MKSLDTREDLSFLVNTFYAKIRKDKTLGPIFNMHISETQWEQHLIKLTDFWETNLFGIAKFKGNPTQKHLNVDHNLDHSIDQFHFERWLQIWFETIDELYYGTNADRIKDAAKRMAQGQFMAIYNNRNQK